ncbi:MAG TPA: hypothetical protein VID31_14540 [Streptosporangiaceae bacterium]|jgi:hypothetical protein
MALYHRFIELVQACGPFTCAVSKSAITPHWLAEAYQVGAGAHLGHPAQDRP